MVRSALLTLDTTPRRLSELLRGIVAGASKTYGQTLNDQVREIQFKCDNGTVYIGSTSDVSSTNYGVKLLSGEGWRTADTEANTHNLSDHWLVGSASGTLVSVNFHSV